MDVFISFISAPIFIGIVLIYSFCITIYFIVKKNKMNSNKIEGIFDIKTPTPLIFTFFFICIFCISTILLSNNLISILYFLLPMIFLLDLIRKNRKLILRKDSLQANKLLCSYKSIQYIDFTPNSSLQKYNLSITINNKTHTFIIQAKDKDKIKELLDLKI